MMLAIELRELLRWPIDPIAHKEPFPSIWSIVPQFSTRWVGQCYLSMYSAMTEGGNIVLARFEAVHTFIGHGLHPSLAEVVVSLIDETGQGNLPLGDPGDRFHKGMKLWSHETRFHDLPAELSAEGLVMLGKSQRHPLRRWRRW
jgi:hypothetical protein